MTKECKIEILKDLLVQLSDSANILCTCEADERCEVAEEYIKALEQQSSEDCVSRAEVIGELNRLGRNAFKDDTDYDNFFAFVDRLPPVTPIHGTCKDCFYYNIDEDGHGYHCEKYEHTRFPVYANFYCADFEKGGEA